MGSLFFCASFPTGSESKLMLGKLKTQLEELRAKVDFLYSVNKYLEVLTPHTISF